MTFSIQKVKGQLHCDITMFCKNTFLDIIQHHNSGTEGEIVTIFHIWSDTELVTLILGVHLGADCIEFLCCLVEDLYDCRGSGYPVWCSR